MLGLCCKKYGAMTNHDGRDDIGDNDRNEDGNGYGNSASGLGSNGLIFDLITMT